MLLFLPEKLFCLKSSYLSPFLPWPCVKQALLSGAPREAEGERGCPDAYPAALGWLISQVVLLHFWPWEHLLQSS